MIMFFDTETTGLPLWGEPSSDPRQPHIVQICACLCEDNGLEHVSFNLVQKPANWTIPAEVVKIHGITTEIATRVGVPGISILRLWEHYAAMAQIWVAHNASFDIRMMRIMAKKLGRPDLKESLAAQGRAPTIFCTQREAKDIVQMPPTNRMMAAGRKTWKGPKLEEAVKHFFGRDFQAHRADSDMRACKAVYYAIKGKKPARHMAETPKPAAPEASDELAGV